MVDWDYLQLILKVENIISSRLLLICTFYATLVHRVHGDQRQQHVCQLNEVRAHNSKNAGVVTKR